MERKTYLNRYRLRVDRVGIPVVIRRSADEATLQADDVKSGGQVAVQLEPAAALGPAEREQLEAEARALQQLNHVNIPVLRDFGFDDDQLFYVTEFLEGTTAEDWIRTKGPMPEGAVLRIGSQVASALAAASAKGIIHYAVHPGNILLVPGQTAEGGWPLIKVLNLVGMAPSLFPTSTNGSAFLNPADFASPEQLRDTEIDFRSELYSLGCALWFLLKGLPPTGGAAVLRYSGGLSAPVRQLLTSMLAENPADRPSDPAAFQQQIKDCLSQIERPDSVVDNSATPATATVLPANKIEPLPEEHSLWKPLAFAAIVIALVTLAVFWRDLTNQRHVAEVADPVSEAPAVASDNGSQTADASATETKIPPLVASSNLEAPLEKDEQSSSEVSGPGAEESPAQIDSRDVSVSKPGVEMMVNVPLEQENLESPAPIVANNSATPDSEIAAIENGPEQLPSITEAPPPPAEGPIESENRIAEVSPTLSSPVVEEEVRKDTPISTPKMTPAKTVKAEHATGSPKKKASTTAPSHSPRTVPASVAAPQFHVVTVGHIFFPVTPGKYVNDTAPPPSHPSVVHKSQHPPRLETSVGHIFPVSPHGLVHDASSSSKSRDDQRHSRRSVHAPAKKTLATAAVPST